MKPLKMKLLRLFSMVYFWLFAAFNFLLVYREYAIKGIDSLILFICITALMLLYLIALFIAVYNTKMIAYRFFKVVCAVFILLILKEFFQAALNKGIIGTFLFYSLVFLPSIFIIRRKFFAKFKRIPPWIFLLGGCGVILFSLLSKEIFNPFILLAFLLASIFEIFFRKQRRFNSNLLSIICAILLIVSIGPYFIGFGVMQSDSMAPKIPKDSTFFYKPSMLEISQGDLVVYGISSDTNNYVGEVKKFLDNDKYVVYRIGEDKSVTVSKDQIKGKIIFILK